MHKSWAACDCHHFRIQLTKKTLDHPCKPELFKHKKECVFQMNKQTKKPNRLSLIPSTKRHCCSHLEGLVSNPNENCLPKIQTSWKHVLVGGFNLSESYISQTGSFPQVGVKIRNIWNHHLVFEQKNYVTLTSPPPKPPWPANGCPQLHCMPNTRDSPCKQKNNWSSPYKRPNETNSAFPSQKPGSYFFGRSKNSEANSLPQKKIHTLIWGSKKTW